MPDYGFEGKVVVITGGGSGMGRASAKAFAEQGAKVVVGDLHPPAAADFAGVAVAPILETSDFRDPEAAGRLVQTAVDAHGGVDVLVNNVGIGFHRDGFVTVSDDDWREMLDLNLMTVVRASRAALPHMVAQRSGSIVSIASDAGRQPDAFLVDYSASKSAILSVSKSMSIEFGPMGIRSNCVSPGPTETRMMSDFLDTLAVEKGIPREDAGRYFAVEMRNLPLGRMNQPEDVANVILFLASDLASQVTGSEYCVNAGSVIAA